MPLIVLCHQSYVVTEKRLSAWQRLLCTERVDPILDFRCRLRYCKILQARGKFTEAPLHELIPNFEKAMSNKEYTLCAFMDIEDVFNDTSFGVGRAVNQLDQFTSSSRERSTYWSDRSLLRQYVLGTNHTNRLSLLRLRSSHKHLRTIQW